MYRYQKMSVPPNMYRVYQGSKHICDVIEFSGGWLAVDQKDTVVYAKEKDDAVDKYLSAKKKEAD